MSIEEKIKTAKEDSWLKDSVSEKEFKEIKDNERRMSNKEAITRLKGLYGNGYPKQEQALDMAIRALKKEQTDGDLTAEIDKLPRIKVGNSNSPTVKYCIDEVLLYELLEHYKADKTAEWIDGKCNKCGTPAPFWAMSSTYYCSEYCPNCGARMKVVEE